MLIVFEILNETRKDSASNKGKKTLLHLLYAVVSICLFFFCFLRLLIYLVFVCILVYLVYFPFHVSFILCVEFLLLFSSWFAFISLQKMITDITILKSGVDTSGKPHLQCYIATQYEKKSQFHKAFYWWKRAANQGHMGATTNVGTCYLMGTGVEQDYEKAASWYLKSSPECDIATLKLGALYFFGEGVPVNYQEALRCFRKGAKKGCTTSQFQLGVMFSKGLGVPKDEVQASKYWTASSSKDCTQSMIYLAEAYCLGKGVPLDYKQGLSLYSRAAELKCTTAYYYLGT